LIICPFISIIGLSFDKRDNRMHIMTRREEEIFDKLLKLADGDSSLLERAFRESSIKYEEADLKDVVNYLVKHRPQAA